MAAHASGFQALKAMREEGKRVMAKNTIEIRQKITLSSYPWRNDENILQLPYRFFPETAVGYVCQLFNSIFAAYHFFVHVVRLYVLSAPLDLIFPSISTDAEDSASIFDVSVSPSSETVVNVPFANDHVPVEP